MLLEGNNYAFATQSVYYWEPMGYGIEAYGRKKKAECGRYGWSATFCF